jgi:hypothetical protein
MISIRGACEMSLVTERSEDLAVAVAVAISMSAVVQRDDDAGNKINNGTSFRRFRSRGSSKRSTP